jgi:hypothetical protein
MAIKIPEYPPVYQLKITLDGIKPLIWRRILVSGDVKLYKLHKILQAVMGWENYHLHLFTVDDVIYAYPSPDDPWPMETKNERRARLSDVVPDEKTKFDYEYDLGDSWHHIVLVEKILYSEEGLERPVCLEGKRCAPPEDCGGKSGYRTFLKAISDPNHPDHEWLLEWAGGEFDPERFDLEKVNGLLAKIR